MGGGYIALEFASMFSNLGTQVTILEHGDVIMPREDREVADLALQDLQDKGISVHTNVETTAFSNEGDSTIVHTNHGKFKADAVLLATGRKPNTDGLGSENTDVKMGQRGEVQVNSQLQTSVKHIYAAGDVKSGLQFTYISLDDFRILRSNSLEMDREQLRIEATFLIQYLSIHLYQELVSLLLKQKHKVLISWKIKST